MMEVPGYQTLGAQRDIPGRWHHMAYHCQRALGMGMASAVDSLL